MMEISELIKKLKIAKYKIDKMILYIKTIERDAYEE